MKKLGFRGLASFLLLLAVVEASQGNKGISPQCRPTWAQLSKAPLSVRSGVHEARFSAIVIGCEENIAGLGADKIKVVQEAVKSIVRENPLSLLAPDSPELRRKMAAAINKALKSPVITDIFFNSVSVGEDM